MSCPAVEHGKAVAESNAKRVAELMDEIKAAGVVFQVMELLEINAKPEAAFTARLAKKRAERSGPHEERWVLNPAFSDIRFTG